MKEGRQSYYSTQSWARNSYRALSIIQEATSLKGRMVYVPFYITETSKHLLRSQIFSIPLKYREIQMVSNAWSMLIILWVILYGIIHFYNLHRYFSFCLWRSKQCTVKHTFQATSHQWVYKEYHNFTTPLEKMGTAPEIYSWVQNSKQTWSYQLCELLLWKMCKVQVRKINNASIMGILQGCTC